jgi:hypothetical protein
MKIDYDLKVNCLILYITLFDMTHHLHDILITPIFNYSFGNTGNRRQSDTWDWDRDYNSRRNSIRDHMIIAGDYIGPWVQSAWDGCMNTWDYFIWKLYGANLVKKLPYNRCHICLNEIDPLYLYNLNDVRHKFCNICYEREAEKMIEELNALDLGF